MEAAYGRSLYFSSVMVVEIMLLIAMNLKMPYFEDISLKVRKISKCIFYLHPF